MSHAFMRTSSSRCMKRRTKLTCDGPDSSFSRAGSVSSWMRLTHRHCLDPVQAKAYWRVHAIKLRKHICCTQAVKTNFCQTRHTRDRASQLMDATEHSQCLDPVQAKAYWRVHAIKLASTSVARRPSKLTCARPVTLAIGHLQLMDATEHSQCLDPVQAKAYWRVHAIKCASTSVARRPSKLTCARAVTLAIGHCSSWIRTEHKFRLQRRCKRLSVATSTQGYTSGKEL